MSDVITVTDLEETKKHNTFHVDVITGRTGDYATNAVTGQVQKTLPATIDGLDWSYVGKFADGVTFTKQSDFAIDANGTQWIYTGNYPFTATAGTVPSEPDYQAVHVRDHNATSDRNAVGAHDAIYRRRTTVAEINSGVFVPTVENPVIYLTVTDRVSAPFNVIIGGSQNGFDILDAGGGNTAVLAESNNDPRVWGAGGDGADVTSVLKRMCEVGQKIYCKADAGETLDWIISGDVEVTHGNFSVKSTRSVTITQTANNTKSFWSGARVNDVEYVKVNLRGVGASDTASTVNADNGTVKAQAYGILFQGASGFVTKDVDVRYFKNDGIRSEYASNVKHIRPHVEGTYPDPDIPDSNTARQQFGISVWASTYAVPTATAQEIKEGTAAPHGASNIRIIGSEIGNTAIATCVFPGYNNVYVDKPKTFGSLAQHSIYAYPAEDLQIDGYELTPTRQEVGIKISNNVLANRLIPKNIRVGAGIIRNTYSPAISIESFDKFDNGTFDALKSGCFFENVEIDGAIISDYHDIGLSLACCRGRVGSVRLLNQTGTTTLRPSIDLRSFGGEIHDSVLKIADRSMLGGAPLLESDETLTLKNNRFIDAAKTAAAVYMSLSPAVAPMELQSGRWYAEGNMVYNPATDEVYRVITTGFTSGTIPTGSGTFAFGTASITYIGLYANLKTKVNLIGNMYDVETGTISTQAVSLNNAKFQTKVRDEWAHPSINTVQIQGQSDMWMNNSYGNTSKVAMTYPSPVATGDGSNTYYGTSQTGPTSGTYERGDIYRVVNAQAGQVAMLICATRGTPGTWKVAITLPA